MAASTHANTQQMATSNPQIFIDAAGEKIMAVFKPTETLKDLCMALAIEFQALIEHSSIKIDEVIRSNEYFQSHMPADCLNLVLAVIKEYDESYKRKIFIDDNGLSDIFDYCKINYRWKPNVLLVTQGLLDNESMVFYMLVPFILTGAIHMTVKTPNGQALDVDWTPGNVILVPGKADLKLEGNGFMVFLAFGFAEATIEEELIPQR